MACTHDEPVLSVGGWMNAWEKFTTPKLILSFCTKAVQVLLHDSAFCMCSGGCSHTSAFKFD